MPEPQEKAGVEIGYEELPNEAELDQQLYKSLFVVFIVDLSGSMSGNKMDITKQALQLFIKSLP